MENLIDADNAHRIPEQNGGMPNVLAYRSQQAIGEVSPDIEPSIEEAICEFTKAGGNLTLASFWQSSYSGLSSPQART